MDTSEYRPLSDYILEMVFELAVFHASTNGNVTVGALIIRDLAWELRERRKLYPEDER
jgi:hypothetical protein